MAAPWRKESFRYLLKFRKISTSCFQLSNAVAVRESNTVKYPPVKPRYPPGRWGRIAESSAWAIDDMGRELLKIPRVKERLEKLAGEINRTLWLVEPMDKRPKNLEFMQRLTKTHVAQNFPDVYQREGVDSDKLYEDMKSDIVDCVDLELEYQQRSDMDRSNSSGLKLTEEEGISHRLLGRIMNLMVSKLALSNRYLLRSQLDENVRVETFWRTGGFAGEGNAAEGKWDLGVTRTKEDLGILTFQYRHHANWQIRAEEPLPCFIKKDDPLCTESLVPHPDYAPPAVGMKDILDRPITVSGHWIGDPCQFGLVSVHVLPAVDFNNFMKLGERYAVEAELSFGMMAAFGSCVAQAHNQGFTYMHDLTYPLTSQCLVTDGRHLRLFAYQLNTLRLWVDDGSAGNPLRNVVWASHRLPLFEGDTKRPNDDAFELLLKSLLIRPSVEADAVLRPYLLEEVDPAKQTVYINNKGQEPLPHVKIGRFQYPRNAVYF